MYRIPLLRLLYGQLLYITVLDLRHQREGIFILLHLYVANFLFNPRNHCILLKYFRFFRYMLILFVMHQMALGLFRMMAAIARDMVLANTYGSASLLVVFLLGGFIVPKGRQHRKFLKKS